MGEFELVITRQSKYPETWEAVIRAGSTTWRLEYEAGGYPPVNRIRLEGPGAEVLGPRALKGVKRRGQPEAVFDEVLGQLLAQLAAAQKAGAPGVGDAVLAAVLADPANPDRPQLVAELANKGLLRLKGG